MIGLSKSILYILIFFFLFVFIPMTVFAEKNQTGAVTAEVLNLRQNPTVSSKHLLAESSNDSADTVVNARNQKDFSYTGTVSKIVAGTIHTISADATNSTRVGTISATAIYVIGASKIIKISTSEISVISVNPTGMDPAGTSPANSSTAGIGTTGSSIDIIGPGADELIRFAKSLLGIPYVYGGISSDGFDCSGFTSYVFGAFGIRLERVSSDQAKQGTEVSKENLKPGDLVFFDTSGGHSSINHTGIFIGDGKFIHASSGTSHYVIISDMITGYYAENYITARRIYRTP